MESPRGRSDSHQLETALVSDFSQEDFDAAAALATTCEHAYDAAHGTGHPERAETLYEKAEELVVRRARELYSQGP